jgi:DNA helicase-2/ATP-dependent DNA helicase PcrA
MGEFLHFKFSAIIYSVMNYLDELNPPQKEAVLHQEGPLLIVAGAGAGKTRTITYRIFRLIEQGIAPNSILAITFTNKAAAEMRERIEKLLHDKRGETNFPTTMSSPFTSTFHALGVYILRQSGQVLGLPKFFSILDRDESLTKIKEAIRLANVDEKRFEPRKMLSAISRQKGSGQAVAEYTRDARDYFSQTVAAVWHHYDTILNREKVLDFDDLLLKTVYLLKNYPEIREHYQKKWRYIHIDEYQDTNSVQYEMSRLLIGPAHNICVVGDMDQSIYGWRGADFTNLLHFEKDYPDAKVVLLEENYRSTQTILTAANAVIKKNRQRHDKTLFTKNKDGQKIGIFASLDEISEGDFVARKAGNLINQGLNPATIAVLYRANFQSRVLEESFLRESVPYQVLGTRFFERKEIKDLLAFIRLALNENDLEGLKRAINIPPRGIGKVTLLKILAGEEEQLPAKMRQKIAEFRDLLAKIKEVISTKNCSESIKYILEKTGIEKELKEGGEEGTERLENLRELVSIATKYDHLPPGEGMMDLVCEMSLTSDQDSLNEKRDSVKLMTVHAAKGLEFDYVFIVGLEQDLFPHTGFGDEKKDMEEERRLFYVAVTRAREKLFLSYAQTRMIYGNRQVGMPSEFIFDIDDSLLEAETSEGSDTINF